MAVTDPTAVELEIINARLAYHEAAVEAGKAPYGEDLVDDVGEETDLSALEDAVADLETAIASLSDDFESHTNGTDNPAHDSRLIGNTIASLTPTTGSVEIDFTANHHRYLTHALSGTVTYSAVNVAAGKTVTIKVVAGGGTRTLNFPAWVFLGTEPTEIASGKIGILTVTYFDNTDANAIAAWNVQA